MENKKGNVAVIIMLIILILVFATLTVLFALGILSFNSNIKNQISVDNNVIDEKVNSKVDETQSVKVETLEEKIEKNGNLILAQKSIKDEYNSKKPGLYLREQVIDENGFLKIEIATSKGKHQIDGKKFKAVLTYKNTMYNVVALTEEGTIYVFNDSFSVLVNDSNYNKELIYDTEGIAVGKKMNNSINNIKYIAMKKDNKNELVIITEDGNVYDLNGNKSDVNL